MPSTSGASTPRRGRRQLPQLPPTPRPRITYSPVVRRPASIGPPQQLSPCRMTAPIPRRYPQSDSHVSSNEGRAAQNDSPRSHRHTRGQCSDAPRAGCRHSGPYRDSSYEGPHPCDQRTSRTADPGGAPPQSPHGRRLPNGYSHGTPRPTKSRHERYSESEEDDWC